MELRSVLDKLESIEKTNESVRGALDNVRRMNPVKESPQDQIRDFEGMLDEAAEHIESAIHVLSVLSRQSRGFVSAGGGSFSGQLDSYIIPHLQSWVESKNQPGSIATLRGMLEGNNGDEE